MEIYLISENTLKSESYINDNVGGELLLPSIVTAQDIHLQQLIGTKLYKKLKELIKNDDVNGYYKTLMDEYIKPFLINAVMADIQIPLAFKMRNAGIVQTQNDHVNSNYMNDVQTLKTYYEQKMNFYGQRMTDWLCANTEHITEYMYRDDVSQMPADRNAFNTGIYLG